MKKGFGRAEAYGETNGSLQKETERKLTEKNRTEAYRKKLNGSLLRN